MNRILPSLACGFVLTGIVYAQTSAPPSNPVPALSSQTEQLRATPAATNDSKPSGEGTAEVAVDPASLLPDLPSLPKSKTTLIGGTIEKLDRVQDRLTLRAFGGDKIRVAFDTRTRIFQDGTNASAADLHPGDRVYIDTMLDGTSVFARNISIKRSASLGESHGVIVEYHSDKGELVMRDALSPRPVKVKVTSATRVTQGDHAVSSAKLSAGTLISVKFGSESNGRDVAREVSILAVPGTSFTFAGVVVALDLRSGLLVVNSSTDGKPYEIYLDPASVRIDSSLHEGSEVTVRTSFDGSRYVARSMTVSSSAAH